MVSDGFWSLSPDPAVPNSQGGQALDQLPPPPRPSSTAPLRLGSDFEVLKVMSWRSDMDQMACTVLEVWNINGVPSNSIYVFRFTLCCDFVLFPMKGYERDNSSDHTCPPDSQHSTAQLFFLSRCVQVVRLRCLPIWGDSRRICLHLMIYDGFTTALILEFTGRMSRNTCLSGKVVSGTISVGQKVDLGLVERGLLTLPAWV